MKIQVDVDSTLYDSDKLFHRVSEAEFDFEWPTKYYKWFGPDFIGTDLDSMLKMFERAHGEDYALDNVPYPGAVDVLRGISEDYSEVEIAYVSDRSDKLGEVLRKWLDQEGFLSTPDQHVIVGSDKRHWMRENRPEIVIDDRVRTMLMARYELDAQVISLIHPYNQNLEGEAPGIYLVKDWEAIDKVLRGTIIPEYLEKSLSHEKELANAR